MSDVTRILSAIEQGDPHAAEELLPLVYDELRKLAGQRMAQEAPGQTLQATALVHEAYLRLVDVNKVQHWSSRGHFFAAAAEAMRRILVEQARRKRAHKRGGRLFSLTLGQTVTGAPYMWPEAALPCPAILLTVIKPLARAVRLIQGMVTGAGCMWPLAP